MTSKQELKVQVSSGLQQSAQSTGSHDLCIVHKGLLYHFGYLVHLFASCVSALRAQLIPETGQSGN